MLRLLNIRGLALAVLLLVSVMASARENERKADVMSDVAVVDSCGFFPRLSADGSRLLVSTLDAKELSVIDLNSKSRTIVCSDGLPGFDAVISSDGKVYYVTMEQRADRLVHRTAHCYDPANGHSKPILAAQHGAVRIVQGTKGIAVVGESESYNLKKAGTAVWAERDELCLSRKGKIERLRPVDGSVGYLWAALSPDGKKIVFNAVGKGTFVCDLKGNNLVSLGKYLMPCWYNNDYIVAMNGVGNVQKLNGSRICLVDASSGRLVNLLTDEEVAAIQPSIGAGKVVYTTKNGEVHVMMIDIFYEDE